MQNSRHNQLVKFQFQDGAIKGALPVKPKKSFREFQFQDGAIKGTQEHITPMEPKPFQFQDGAIKGALAMRRLIFLVNFNSKMVRLRAIMQGGTLWRKGDFNSKMVRLRAFRSV